MSSRPTVTRLWAGSPVTARVVRHSAGEHGGTTDTSFENEDCSLRTVFTSRRRAKQVRALYKGCRMTPPRDGGYFAAILNLLRRTRRA